LGSRHPFGFGNFYQAIRNLYAIEHFDDADETLFVAFPIFTGIFRGYWAEIVMKLAMRGTFSRSGIMVRIFGGRCRREIPTIVASLFSHDAFSCCPSDQAVNAKG
jgi:hypothetical protein